MNGAAAEPSRGHEVAACFRHNREGSTGARYSSRNVGDDMFTMLPRFGAFGTAIGGAIGSPFRESACFSRFAAGQSPGRPEQAGLAAEIGAGRRIISAICSPFWMLHHGPWTPRRPPVRSGGDQPEARRSPRPARSCLPCVAVPASTHYAPLKRTGIGWLRFPACTARRARRGDGAQRRGRSAEDGDGGLTESEVLSESDQSSSSGSRRKKGLRTARRFRFFVILSMSFLLAMRGRVLEALDRLRDLTPSWPLT
jgi:hypothetical protein